MDKKSVLKLILKEAENNLQVLIRSAHDARDASTNGEAKAENKYDTRGLEASYLAGAQAKRAEQFKEVVFKIRQMEFKRYGNDDPIGMSALIELAVDESNKWIFVLPASGITVTSNGVRIQAITLEAPLGQLLLGKKVGDEFTLNDRNYSILRVL